MLQDHAAIDATLGEKAMTRYTSDFLAKMAILATLIPIAVGILVAVVLWLITR